MQAAFQHIKPNGQLSWQHHLWRPQRFGFFWHYHVEYELVLITQGSGTRMVGDSIGPYRPGELTLIGPELPHTYVSAGDVVTNEAVVVHFRRDFLGSELFDGPDLGEIGRLLDRAAHGLSFTVDDGLISSLRELDDLPAAACTIRLLDTLLVLTGRPGNSLATRHYDPPRLEGKARDRIDTVCQMMNANYNRPVALADVARAAHMTPPAFSRFFHRAMGRTMTAYLNELRVGMACRLLIDTDMPIVAVAVESGFANLSHFNRRFRIIRGTTPREYRNAFRPESHG